MSTTFSSTLTVNRQTIPSASEDFTFYEQDALIAHVGEDPEKDVPSEERPARRPRKRRASAANADALRKRTRSSLAATDPITP